MAFPPFFPIFSPRKTEFIPRPRRTRTSAPVFNFPALWKWISTKWAVRRIRCEEKINRGATLSSLIWKPQVNYHKRHSKDFCICGNEGGKTREKEKKTKAGDTKKTCMLNSSDLYTKEREREKIHGTRNGGEANGRLDNKEIHYLFPPFSIILTIGKLLE